MGLKVHRPGTVYMGDVLASGTASFIGASLTVESAVIAWDLGLHGGTWILGPWEPTRCQLPLMGPQYLVHRIQSSTGITLEPGFMGADLEAWVLGSSVALG